MSQPIKRCLISKAAQGCEKSIELLSKAMKINLQYGGFTIVPCDCNPKCKEPTEEQLEKLNKIICEFVGRKVR